MNSWCNFFHTHALGFLCFQDTRQFWLVIIILATGGPVLSAIHPFRRPSRRRWDFQLSPWTFDDLLQFLILRFNEINTSTSSDIVELWFFTCRPILLSPSFLSFLTYFSRFSGRKLSGLYVVCRLVNLLPDHMYPSGGFPSIRWIVWNLSMSRTNLWTHQCSNNRRCGFLVLHPRWYE